jgi:hypothetical protein
MQHLKTRQNNLNSIAPDLDPFSKCINGCKHDGVSSGAPLKTDSKPARKWYLFYHVA